MALGTEASAHGRPKRHSRTLPPAILRKSMADIVRVTLTKQISHPLTNFTWQFLLSSFPSSNARQISEQPGDNDASRLEDDK